MHSFVRTKSEKEGSPGNRGATEKMTEIIIKIIVTCTLAYVAYEDHKVHELPVLLIFAMLGICSAIRLIWGMPFPVSEALLGLFIAAVPFLAMV